ncbi:TolC family protein [Chondrinema litorale]|uniref:TolC family protein n=1 Tax=Chondrinema litorale TaxID=2994555 RepID=UPI002543D5AE|nr:TolC family protein [Chondrinema litorale]UZR99941.1 TolC family protein [Chondrinema litorale]
MRNIKYIFLLLISLFTSFLCKAQTVSDATGLGIQEIIAITLENNYDIKISKNTSKSTSIDAVPGNAGYLPTVALSGSYNYSSSNSDIVFADPTMPEISASGAVTENIAAGVTLNYNIYSGGNRKYTYEKLKNENYLSDLQLQQSIETSVLNVVSQFLNVVNYYDSYEINKESVDISLKRYERAENNYSFGAMSKLELLNAEVDLRNDSTNLVQSKVAFEKSIKDLNNLMGIDPDSTYTINPDFTIEDDLVVAELIEDALNKNTSYLLARSTIRSRELDLKITKTNYLPTLDFSGGYEYSNVSYGASFISTQKGLGWNAGISVSYNIFDAGSRKREKEKAEIQVINQQLSIDQTKNNLKTDLLKAYDDYQSNINLLSLTERNVKTAMINYERSTEAFSTGQITGIELREAQLNLLNAKYNVSLQRLQAKISEVSLHYYSGNLVK